jgi:release factor glutamine methyltransferase
MAEQKTWNVVELLKTTVDYFTEKRVVEARLSAELLLGQVLGLQRLQLYLSHERPVMPRELEAFRELCRQRLQGRPVQYIAGEAFFYGNRFRVDERVLIPRPETELVLEHALERLAAARPGLATPSIIDIGTGSGCIAATMAKMLPGAGVVAVDVSEGALQLARENAIELGVADRVRFVLADLFDPGFSGAVGSGFDLVVSNPPYIPETEWAGLQQEVRCHEPKLALVSPGGFECYEAIAARAPALLGKGGVLCFELHADAAAGVRKLVAPAFAAISVMQDYAGLDRALSCVLP